jgi:hypothetical protein
MVERSRRRRGMYDITRTRMLMATAVFAAVAAVFAGGANARALDEDGSGIGAQPAAAVTATGSQYSVMSSRLKGLLRAAQTRDRESGALSGQPTSAKPGDPGTIPYPSPGINDLVRIALH